MDVREVIYKHTLKNALEFGKAKEKAILGKVLAELPEYREKIREIIPIINEVVKEVNSYPRERIEEEIKKYEFIKVERKKEALPELKVKDKVVLRFAPNPSDLSTWGIVGRLYSTTSMLKDIKANSF